MPDYPAEDCYETLGVHSEAPQGIISATFKKLAEAYHPDKFGSASIAARSFAEEKFKKISAAYDELKDPDRRRNYDEWRRPKLTVRPNSLDFGALNPGESRTERLTVENEKKGKPVTGEINFNLAADPSHFSPVPEPSDGVTIFVDVTFDGTGSLPGQYSDSFTVTIGGVQAAQIPLVARVRSVPTTAPPSATRTAYTPPTPAAPLPTPSTPLAAKSGVSPGWAIALGWISGFIFAQFVGPIAIRVVLAVLPQAPPWLGFFAFVSRLGSGTLLGVAVTGVLSGKRRRARVAVVFAAGFALVLAILVGIAAVSDFQSSPSRMSFTGSTIKLEGQIIGTVSSVAQVPEWLRAEIGQRSISPDNYPPPDNFQIRSLIAGSMSITFS